MSNDWDDVVKEKIKSDDFGQSVFCLREEDACCVIGDKIINVSSGPVTK